MTLLAYLAGILTGLLLALAAVVVVLRSSVRFAQAILGAIVMAAATGKAPGRPDVAQIVQQLRQARGRVQ